MDLGATYVLGPPERDPGDPSYLLQTKSKESLPSLTLRARLDLVQRGLGGGILIVVVIVIVVMLLVVGVDFLDGGRHLEAERRSAVITLGGTSEAMDCHPSEWNAFHSTSRLYSVCKESGYSRLIL